MCWFDSNDIQANKLFFFHYIHQAKQHLLQTRRSKDSYAKEKGNNDQQIDEATIQTIERWLRRNRIPYNTTVPTANRLHNRFSFLLIHNTQLMMFGYIDDDTDTFADQEQFGLVQPFTNVYQFQCNICCVRLK